MQPRLEKVPIHGDTRVTAAFQIPEQFHRLLTPGIIFAHGAGNDMDNPLLVYLAQGLTQNGYLTVRFNFPYREKGGRRPDSQQVLEQTWQQVLAHVASHPRWAPGQVFAAGKSMGGRVASQLAASGTLAVAGLIFLGYPLHPPGNKQQLRDAHLPAIRVPMLFIAGSRDSLCDLQLLAAARGRLQAPHELLVIEGGDHSFRVSKSLGSSQQEVYQQILERIISWLRRLGQVC